MYLNTLVHPSYSAKDDTTYILEIFKNETLSAKYGNVIATEFFNFVDNLSKIFAEQNDEFSIIYRELRGLANWIAIKTNISEHKTELLNKALSICDLGIIGLLDSNEHAFESLKKLRTNTKHIEIIYGMITNLSSFSDIKDIVLYHHIDYNDTGYKLSGDDVPIQSYIISTADFLLTHIVMGESVDDALEYLESYCGTRISPTICKSILHGNTREELIEILSMVLTTQ